jgi:predicted DNA-binding protein (UPF0251 family)
MTTEPIRDVLGRRRPETVTHYTEAQKAEAVRLGDELTDDVAGEQLGIPRRNISRWRRSTSPAIQAVILEGREAVIETLKEAQAIGARRLREIVSNPKSSARDITRAFEATSEHLALLSGGPTARTESTVTTETGITSEEQEQLRDFLDSVIRHLDDGGDPDDITAKFLERNALNDLTEVRKSMGYYVLDPEEARARLGAGRSEP